MSGDPTGPARGWPGLAAERGRAGLDRVRRAARARLDVALVGLASDTSKQADAPVGLGLGGAPRGELITGCGILDQPPDQPASAQRERRKHVLATVATGLRRSRGPIVRASLRKAPDSCPHPATFKPILLLRPSRKASSWTRDERGLPRGSSSSSNSSHPTLRSSHPCGVAFWMSLPPRMAKAERSDPAPDTAPLLPPAVGRAQPARPDQRPDRSARRARRAGGRADEPEGDRRSLHPRLTRHSGRARPLAPHLSQVAGRRRPRHWRHRSPPAPP